MRNSQDDKAGEFDHVAAGGAGGTGRRGGSSSTHGPSGASFANGNGPPPAVWGQETHWWQLV